MPKMQNMEIDAYSMVTFSEIWYHGVTFLFFCHGSSLGMHIVQFGAHPGVIQSFTSNWLKQWSVSRDCGIHWYPQIVTMTIQCSKKL